jgi:hypothetical protein
MVILAGHVACMGAMRNCANLLSENLKGSYYLGYEGLDGMIILK